MGFEKIWRQWPSFSDKGYECLGLAGVGAFSEVYCLEDEEGVRYACKVSSEVELLQREAEIMSKFRHPLFPIYYGFWQEDQRGFLLMEYVNGSTVKEMLDRRSFGVCEVLHMGLALAEGLRVLHEYREPIVFRDVKPANVMIRQDGMVKLIDFGCAYPMGVSTTSRGGTPGFAAPEQLEGGSVLTAASDVYGWGQTLKAVIRSKENDLTALGSEDRRKGMDTKVKQNSMVKNGFVKEINRSIYKQYKKRERVKRQTKKQIWEILEACTRQEENRRIPDMRSVMAALIPFMSLYVLQGNNRNDRKRTFLYRKVVCEKNRIIIQS